LEINTLQEMMEDIIVFNPSKKRFLPSLVQPKEAVGNKEKNNSLILFVYKPYFSSEEPLSGSDNINSFYRKNYIFDRHWKLID
jgi:hypothetical protein